MSRQSSFVYNFLLIVILNLLVKLYWVFGVDLQVQNEMGTETYGLYFTFFQYSWIFMVFADPGINNLNNRLVAARPSRLPFYFYNLFTAKLLFGVIAILLMLVLGLVLGYRGNEIWLLLLVGFNLVLISFYAYLRSNITGLQLFTTESILSITDKLIMGLICSIFLWIGFFHKYFNIYVFGLIQTLGYFIAIGISLRILLSKIELQRRPSRRFTKKFLRTALPYALLMGLMSLYTRTDTVLLERLLPDGKHQAGIYASSFRLLDSLNMFGVLMASLLLPLFARILSQKFSPAPVVKKAWVLALLPGLSIPLIMALYYKEAYAFLYPGIHDPMAMQVFFITILCFIPICFGYIFGTLLTANGRLKFLIAISLIAFVINFSINLWLIPSRQSLGAAITALITQSLVTIAQVIYAMRVYHLHLRWPFLLRHIFVLAGAALCYYLLYKASLPILVGTFASVACVALLVLASGMVKLKELKIFILRKG